MRKPTFVLAILALAASATYCKADSITGVTFTGSAANPTITVTGSGFGATAPAGTPNPGPGTGDNYGTSLYLTDNTSGFTAGYDNGVAVDYIGLVLDSYSDTSITFGLGSYYNTNYADMLAAGDSYTVGVLGTTADGTVSYSSVTPEPSSLLLLGTGALGLLGAARRRFA